MDSKRKANGNTAAVEDLDDRAVKRRKLPVSITMFFRFVRSVRYGERCVPGHFNAPGYRLHTSVNVPT